MALTEHEMEVLRKSCEQLPKGPDYRCNDYVENLLITALDFQQRVETVEAAMGYFREVRPAKGIEDLARLIDTFPNTKDGNIALAQKIWKNNHWTRAKFLRMLVERFQKLHVLDQSSLVEWLEKVDFEADVKGKFKTAEHSMGVAISNWLALRSGLPTVKPDLHVLNFVKRLIGRKPSQEEAVSALRIVADESGIEPFRLDSAIWHFQREGVVPLRSEDAVTARDEIKIGSTVLVVSEWDGDEYLGRVSKVQSTAITVTFPGWGSEWDETLRLSAIRYRESA
jgi:hypothetical protein